MSNFNCKGARRSCRFLYSISKINTVFTCSSKSSFICTVLLRWIRVIIRFLRIDFHSPTFPTCAPVSGLTSARCNGIYKDVMVRYGDGSIYKVVQRLRRKIMDVLRINIMSFRRRVAFNIITTAISCCISGRLIRIIRMSRYLYLINFAATPQDPGLVMSSFVR